jgi:hypothetical protein
MGGQCNLGRQQRRYYRSKQPDVPNGNAAGFSVYGQTLSAVDIFNHSYGSNLNGTQVEDAIILHELEHIAGGKSDTTVDSFDEKSKLIAKCIH